MFCPKCGNEMNGEITCAACGFTKAPEIAPEMPYDQQLYNNAPAYDVKKHLPVLAVAGVALVLVIVLIIVIANACGKGGSDYKKPVKQYFEALQENDPDKMIAAFGKENFYAAYEEYYEYWEEYYEDDFDDGREMGDEYMDELADDWNDYYEDFTYEITEVEHLDARDGRELKYSIYLIDEIEITDAYRLELEFEADDSDVEDSLEYRWEEVYVGKVDGKWVLLNVDDMFNLYY